MSRQFHYVLVYDEDTSTWYLENYDASDGNIWDTEEQEWRWADDEAQEGEQDLDGNLHEILYTATSTLALPKITPTGEEPDLLYESE